MRIVSTLILAACAAAFLAPTALANQASPASGTAFHLNPGDKGKVKIKGFGGCKFEVELMTTDSKVVQVSAKKDGTAKGHTVTLEAVAPGTAMVTVMTANGTNPGCQGFSFTYPVTVTPDVKDLQKAVKKKTKEQLKEIGSVLDEVVDGFCANIDGVVDQVKDGTTTPDEAVDALQDFGAQVASGYASSLGFLVDGAFNEIWSCPEAQGYMALTQDLTSFLPGGCGEYDAFADKVEKTLDKAAKKVDKKIKKAIKQIDKVALAQEEAVLFLFDLLVGVPVPNTPVALPADPEQTPAAAPPKPVTHDWTSSGRLSASAVTSLRLGGTADAGEGQVTIAIVGPDGFSTSQMVDVDEDCEWIVDFSGIKPGHYTVTITQGSQSKSTTVVAA